MKLGILTFPDATSYGAVLQMYALYRAAEKLGAQPEIIHYHNSFMKAQRHTTAMQGTGRLKKKLKLCAKNLMHCRQKQAFRRFNAQLRLYPRRPISDPEALYTLKDRYDGVICGSDQVWNPDITGFDKRYFLDFCGEHTKRISYAPSFGITEFSPQFRDGITEHVRRFDLLSAREAHGRDLLRQLTGRDVPMVLDPTFLLSREDWMQLEEKHPAAREPYILYYTVLRSDTLLRFCLQKAREEHLKVVFVGGNPIKQLKNKEVEYAYDLSPGQWLYLLHHADCVVTNSFHGTAFSIHYEKNFYLEMSSLTNSRLQQIVDTAGLQDRVVGPACGSGDIDYDLVRRRIAPEKEASLAYLKKAVEL